MIFKHRTTMAPAANPNYRNDAGRVPLKMRSVQKLKKQARTRPQGRQTGDKKEQRSHRDVRKTDKKEP